MLSVLEMDFRSVHDDSTRFTLFSLFPKRFQNRRMKHKKDTNNVKSVNKPPKSSADSFKPSKESKSPDDCHQDIVKRLMTHSQYFPATTNHPSKPSIGYSKSSANFTRHYPSTYGGHMNSNSYQCQPTVAENNNYYYQHSPNDQKSLQGCHASSGYNTCISPSLLSPLNYLSSFDQLSYIDDCSPRNNDYIFNGEFTMNFNSDFDVSFPLASSGAGAAAAVDVKTSHIMDNQAAPALVYTASGTQLTPLTIESQPNASREIKNSFDDVERSHRSGSNVLVNLSDDDVLSNASSYVSRSPPSGTVEWKFSE